VRPATPGLPPRDLRPYVGEARGEALKTHSRQKYAECRDETTAKAGTDGASVRCFDDPLPALEVVDDPGEHVAHLLVRDRAVQHAVAGDGDRRRFLRHDEHRGVGLLRWPQRGAVARAERFV